MSNISFALKVIFLLLFFFLWFCSCLFLLVFCLCCFWRNCVCFYLCLCFSFCLYLCLWLRFCLYFLFVWFFYCLGKSCLVYYHWISATIFGCLVELLVLILYFVVDYWISLLSVAWVLVFSCSLGCDFLLVTVSHELGHMLFVAVVLFQGVGAISFWFESRT